MNREKIRKIKENAYFGSIGPSVAFSVFIGLGIGVYLDKQVFGTTPYLTVVFLILGVIAGFRNLWHAISKIERAEKEKKSGGDFR